MNSVVTKGYICVNAEGILYRLSEIEHIEREDGSFVYYFRPFYSVIDLVDSKYFQGIPGLNLDLKKQEYVRENILPVFISERVPQPNREDYWEMLEKVNMEYMNPLVYLVREKTRYFGDRLIVRPYEECRTVEIDDSTKDNLASIAEKIISELALGNTVIYGDTIIDDSNRKTVFDILKRMYFKSTLHHKEATSKGIESAKKLRKYKGRKPIVVDNELFCKLEEKRLAGEINYQEVAKILNISVDKYYRVRKELRNK